MFCAAFTTKSIACSPSGVTCTSRGRFSALMASRISSASGKLSSASRSVSRAGMDGGDEFWDGEVEGGAVAGGGFDPDSSTVAFNDPLANSQPNTCAAIFLVPMKPFEYAKDFLLVLRIDPDAVIPYGKTHHRAVLDGRDVDLRRFFLTIL